MRLWFVPLIAIVLSLALVPVAAFAATYESTQLKFEKFASNGKWIVEYPSIDQVLIRHKTQKAVIIITEYGSDLPLEEARAYLRKDFKRDIVRTRLAGWQVDGPALKNLNARISPDGEIPFGELEFSLDVPEGIAAFTERLWVTNDRAWQIVVADYGAFTTSPDAQRLEIDDLMAELTASASRGSKSAWIDLLVPRAHAAASELNRSRSTTPRGTAPEPSVKPGGQNSCSHVPAGPHKIDANAAPRLSLSSFKGCAVGAAKAIPEMVVAIGTALAKTGTALCKNGPGIARSTAAYVGRTASAEAKRCGDQPNSAKMGWIAYAKAEAYYSGCIALLPMSIAVHTGYDLTAATVRGAGAAASWVWAHLDLPLVMFNYIKTRVHDLGCFDAETQMKAICGFVVKAAASAAAIGFTGGAAGAALAGARGVAILDAGMAGATAALTSASGIGLARNVLSRAGRSVAADAAESAAGEVVGAAVTAEKNATAAAKALRDARRSGNPQAIRSAEEASRAAEAARVKRAKAVRDLELTSTGRARAATQALGRKVTNQESGLIERAHKLGTPNSAGKYSVPDLRAKLKLMTDGGLSRPDALKLLRTGVTGEATPTAIADATAAAPSTAVIYERAWKVADRADTQTLDHLNDFRTELAAGNTSQAMDSLRAAQGTARTAARAYEESGAIGRAPANFKLAMENYITAGDAQGAAGARLTAVRTLGESPSAVSNELRTAIQRLSENPRVTTDAMLGQRLGFLKQTLEKFEAGSQSAAAQFEKSGATRVGAGSVARSSPRSLIEPAPLKAKPVAPAPALPPAAARVVPLRNDPYLNMAESFKSDGNVAARIVRETVESGSTEKINKLVEDIRTHIPAHPTETQRAQILRSVQEIRRLEGHHVLTNGNVGQLSSMERQLIEPARNPVALANNGKVSEAAAIYRERLQNGWPRNLVENDIRSEIRNATMMRDGILRSAARNPRARIPNQTATWDRIIESNESVLRELGK
jgi:hypothetical protein